MIPVSVIVPTIPGFEEMLARCVESYEAAGCEVVVVEDSPSAGAGWNLGAEQAARELLWFSAHDTTLVRLGGAVVEEALAGVVICPVIEWPDGSHQGAGGHNDRMPDGQVARNCAFPLLSRERWVEIGPGPPTHHYCDCWITMEAQRLNAGPVVRYGACVTHAHFSDEIDSDYAAWTAWFEKRERERATV